MNHKNQRKHDDRNIFFVSGRDTNDRRKIQIYHKHASRGAGKRSLVCRRNKAAAELNLKSPSEEK